MNNDNEVQTTPVATAGQDVAAIDRRWGSPDPTGLRRQAAPTQQAADVVSDPAKDDTEGQDWSDEGGATPAGPSTNDEQAAC
jgi:hypothetical protein